MTSKHTLGLLENAKKKTATAGKDKVQLLLPINMAMDSYEIIAQANEQEKAKAAELLESEENKKKKEEEKQEKVKKIEEEKKRKEIEKLENEKRKEMEWERKREKGMEKERKTLRKELEEKCRLCFQSFRGPSQQWEGCDHCEFWLCGGCMEACGNAAMQRHNLFHTQKRKKCQGEEEEKPEAKKQRKMKK